VAPWPVTSDSDAPFRLMVWSLLALSCVAAWAFLLAVLGVLS